MSLCCADQLSYGSSGMEQDTVIYRAKMHGKSGARLIGGTVNRGTVNTCSIVKHDIGGTQRDMLDQGTR